MPVFDALWQNPSSVAERQAAPTAYSGELESARATNSVLSSPRAEGKREAPKRGSCGEPLTATCNFEQLDLLPGKFHFEPPSHHSITSSAATSSLSGTVRPSILAVEALMTSSNLLDCTTGKSAGFAPLTIRPAYAPT